MEGEDWIGAWTIVGRRLERSIHPPSDVLVRSIHLAASPPVVFRPTNRPSLRRGIAHLNSEMSDGCAPPGETDLSHRETVVSSRASRVRSSALTMNYAPPLPLASHCEIHVAQSKRPPSEAPLPCNVIPFNDLDSARADDD